MFDLAQGMQIAQLRAGATGRVARRGLSGKDTLQTQAEAEVDAAREAIRSGAAAGQPGGGNSVMVDPKVSLLDPKGGPKVSLLDPKGGVTPDSYTGASVEATLPPGDTVGTQLVPVPNQTILDRFNNLSTPAKVGVVGGGVVAVAGLIWLLKG